MDIFVGMAGAFLDKEVFAVALVGDLNGDVERGMAVMKAAILVAQEKMGRS